MLLLLWPRVVRIHPQSCAGEFSKVDSGVSPQMCGQIDNWENW